MPFDLTFVSHVEFADTAIVNLWAPALELSTTLGLAPERLQATRYRQKFDMEVPPRTPVVLFFNVLFRHGSWAFLRLERKRPDFPERGFPSLMTAAVLAEQPQAAIIEQEKVDYIRITVSHSAPTCVVRCATGEEIRGVQPCTDCETKFGTIRVCC